MDLFRRLINRFYPEKKTHALSIDTIPNLSKIISILKNNSLKVQSDYAILIGSRAAQFYLPNIRRTSNDKNIDWDIICSSQYLLAWLHKRSSAIETIEMITTASIDDNLLDYYVYCILKNNFKYDFSIPRSSESYTAYLLNNRIAFTSREYWHWQLTITMQIAIGSPELLLILKKCMLYYSHQWTKTAKDYRQLLTIAEPLTINPKVLCDLFIRYNEKVHGNRTANNDNFFLIPSNTQKDVKIERDKFFQQEKDQQLALIWHTAMSMAIGNDVLIGLEKMCTEGSLWLANFIIDNWLAIHHQKLKQKILLPKNLIEFEVDNYRLFPELPELILARILYQITDVSDFYSMQFVCKRWYTILRQDDFWRDLYFSRYGNTSPGINDVHSWKMMYFLKVEGTIYNNAEELQQLIDASLQVRQTKVMDVIQLWENWTHKEQAIEPDVFFKLNYILSNLFYIQLRETSDEYKAKLVIFGLDHSHTRTIVDLKLRVGECGNSRNSYPMEGCSIQLISAENTCRSLNFCGPELFGFYCGCWDYAYNRQDNLLTETSSTLCSQFPSGLIICLFILLTHPSRRGQYIQYLKRLKNRLVKTLEYW